MDEEAGRASGKEKVAIVDLKLTLIYGMRDCNEMKAGVRVRQREDGFVIFESFAIVTVMGENPLLMYNLLRRLLQSFLHT